MKKILSVLIGLVIMISSIIAQDDQYSLNMDSIGQGKVVNVKVSNSPNITIRDATLIDNIVVYRLEQANLLNRFDQLNHKVEQLYVTNPKEELVRNKGYTDEKVKTQLHRNRYLFLFSLIVTWISFTLSKANKPFNTAGQFLYFIAVWMLALFVGTSTYYILSTIFNPDYLILKDLIRLFG